MNPRHSADCLWLMDVVLFNTLFAQACHKAGCACCRLYGCVCHTYNRSRYQGVSSIGRFGQQVNLAYGKVCTYEGFRLQTFTSKDSSARDIFRVTDPLYPGVSAQHVITGCILQPVHTFPNHAFNTCNATLAARLIDHRFLRCELEHVCLLNDRHQSIYRRIPKRGVKQLDGASQPRC